MKHFSQKRALLNKAAHGVRDSLKEQVGRCEFCLKPRMPDRLACHEISNGNGMRLRAQDKPFAILVVCLEPWGKPPCHQTVQQWSEAKQLALLWLVRIGDFDLAAYNFLVNQNAPNRITFKEVMREVDGILNNIPALMDRKAQYAKIAGAGGGTPASLNTLSLKGAKHV